jgi:hypothetical protein
MRLIVALASLASAGHIVPGWSRTRFYVESVRGGGRGFKMQYKVEWKRHMDIWVFGENVTAAAAVFLVVIGGNGHVRLINSEEVVKSACVYCWFSGGGHQALGTRVVYSMYMCMCVYVSACVYLHVFIYVWCSSCRHSL